MPKVYLDTGRKTEKVKYDSVEVSGRFIQVYSDLYPKLVNLSPCGVHLLFWMASKMGDYNQIVMNKNTRGDFIAEHRGRYKDGTVKKAVSSLVKSELIVSMSDAGKRESLYFINPFHFWKTGSQKDRAEAIKGYLYKLKENEKH
jgi:hypothetical protein